MYLSPAYVAKGTCLGGEASVLFYHQSGDFIHRDLERAYELEVMASATNSKEIGPWQILAAANVLHWRIHSVYPNLGGSVVQREVNRGFYSDHATSQSQPANFPIWIMWSSNREDLVNVNPVFWMASHFVPLVKEGVMWEQDTDDDILNQGFFEAPLPKVGDFITSFHIGRRLVQYHALVVSPEDHSMELHLQEGEFTVKYLWNSGNTFVFPVKCFILHDFVSFLFVTYWASGYKQFAATFNQRLEHLNTE